ncbi:MAG: hypothetical protein V1831_04655, partial [Candidatus Woesearchaeota archaeon]
GRPSGRSSDVNFDQINEKLNRILKILGAGKEPVEGKQKFKKPKKEEQPNKIEEEKPKNIEKDIKQELPDLEEPKNVMEKKPKKKAKKKKE